MPNRCVAAGCGNMPNDGVTLFHFQNNQNFKVLGRHKYDELRPIGSLCSPAAGVSVCGFLTEYCSSLCLFSSVCSSLMAVLFCLSSAYSAEPQDPPALFHRDVGGGTRLAAKVPQLLHRAHRAPNPHESSLLPSQGRGSLHPSRQAPDRN